MLKTNLASRPFYNERLVTAALALVALVVVGLTAFNVMQVVSLSRQHTAYRTRINADAAQTGRIQANAVALQRTLDRAALQQLAGQTREANLLIDQRTFSWTVFFSLIEKTLPIDVHLVSVSPEIDKNGSVMVSMIVIARRTGDLDAFIRALEGTGAFYGLLPRSEERNDDGTHRATIRGYYLAPRDAGARGKGRP